MKRENVTLPQQAQIIHDRSGVCWSTSGSTGCQSRFNQTDSNCGLAHPGRCVAPRRVPRTHKLFPGPRERICPNRRPATKSTMPSTNPSRHKKTQISTDHEGLQAQGPMGCKPFITLKAQLISEPVLSAPVYDGTPFILTTDGSKDAFTGILAQRIKSTLPGGK
jgi:hypothetical protein